MLILVVLPPSLPPSVPPHTHLHLLPACVVAFRHIIHLLVALKHVTKATASDTFYCHVEGLFSEGHRLISSEARPLVLCFLGNKNKGKYIVFSEGLHISQLVLCQAHWEGTPSTDV